MRTEQRDEVSIIICAQRSADRYRHSVIPVNGKLWLAAAPGTSWILSTSGLLIVRTLFTFTSHGVLLLFIHYLRVWWCHPYCSCRVCSCHPYSILYWGILNNLACLQAVCGIFYRGTTPEIRSSLLLVPSWTCAKIGLGRVTKRGKGVGEAREKPPARKPVFRESQILTSSAGGRGILIGRFTANHRQFVCFVCSAL